MLSRYVNHISYQMQLALLTAPSSGRRMLSHGPSHAMQCISRLRPRTASLSLLRWEVRSTPHSQHLRSFSSTKRTKTGRTKTARSWIIHTPLNTILLQRRRLKKQRRFHKTCYHRLKGMRWQRRSKRAVRSKSSSLRF